MGSQTNVDSSASSSETEGGCARTSVRTAAYLQGSLSRAEQTEFRRHRRACPGCEESFRESLALTSDVARKRREERELAERARRRARRRVFAIQGSHTRHGGRSNRKRNAHLRLFLMPAFAVFLMLVIYPKSRDWGPARVQLTVSEGSVLVSGDSVPAGAEARTLKRGDWCSLNGGGAAELSLGETRLGLGTGALLLIENSADLRVRLDAGRLAIEGPCMVTTEVGVVEVAGGSGWISKNADGLEVHAFEGDWVASNSRGQKSVSAGQTVLLGLR